MIKLKTSNVSSTSIRQQKFKSHPIKKRKLQRKHKSGTFIKQLAIDESFDSTIKSYVISEHVCQQEKKNPLSQSVGEDANLWEDHRKESF